MLILFLEKIMKLRYVSLTGADDNVEIKDLESFSKQYPFFECAILMFPEREGKNRNPSKAWRNKFYDSSVGNRAIHLCGSIINKLAEQDPDLISELNRVQRVQINLKPQWASVELVEKLVVAVKSLPHIEFITQYNDSNREYFKYWEGVENHSYLYDASLGKGLAPDNWSAPVKDKRTGYAGGMSPENVEENILKISQVSNINPVWIDMESGVRTDDRFDLKKAEDVLAITAKVLNLENIIEVKNNKKI